MSYSVLGKTVHRESMEERLRKGVLPSTALDNAVMLMLDIDTILERQNNQRGDQMELLARPEARKGHEEVIEKLEYRIATASKLLGDCWQTFIKDRGITDPPTWPSKYDKEFEEAYPESIEAKDCITDSLKELPKHLTQPDESAQTYAIMSSIRGGKVTQVAELSILLDDAFKGILQEALKSRVTQENSKVIHIGLTADELKVLTAEDHLKIVNHLNKFIPNNKEYLEKNLLFEEAKKLASWCSYWGNLGHGSDVFFDSNYL